MESYIRDWSPARSGLINHIHPSHYLFGSVPLRLTLCRPLDRFLLLFCLHFQGLGPSSTLLATLRCLLPRSKPRLRSRPLTLIPATPNAPNLEQAKNTPIAPQHQTSILPSVVQTLPMHPGHPHVLRNRLFRPLHSASCKNGRSSLSTNGNDVSRTPSVIKRFSGHDSIL